MHSAAKRIKELNQTWEKTLNPQQLQERENNKRTLKGGPKIFQVRF
jgi:hypothetical protein